jgi:hypothetical protein
MTTERAKTGPGPIGDGARHEFAADLVQAIRRREGIGYSRRCRFGWRLC